MLVEYFPGEKNWLADHLSRKDSHWDTLRRLDAGKEWFVSLEEIFEHISQPMNCP